MHACMQACMNACMHAYTHIHMYMHYPFCCTSMCAYMRFEQHTNVTHIWQPSPHVRQRQPWICLSLSNVLHVHFSSWRTWLACRRWTCMTFWTMRWSRWSCSTPRPNFRCRGVASGRSLLALLVLLLCSALLRWSAGLSCLMFLICLFICSVFFNLFIAF